MRWRRLWGWFVLCLVLASVASGPALATLISTQQEINIERQVARELEGKYGVYRDPNLTSRLVAIGERLAAVSEHPDPPYAFKILKASEVNAVAAPGVFIYLTRGVVFFVRSDDELAFVLGHEVAHAARRHGAQMNERNIAWSLGLWILIRVFGGDPTAVQIADFARFLITGRYNREFEFEADHYGILYVRRAGWTGTSDGSTRPPGRRPPSSLRRTTDRSTVEGMGGWEPVVKRIPLVLVGEGIHAGLKGPEESQMDIAPTVSILLGLPIPAHNNRRPLVEALEGDLQAAVERWI